MSSRHRRTRIYGANYDIGESYYKKQLNDLDNKAGSHRNINPTLGVETLNESKSIPKVSFLCSDSNNDIAPTLTRRKINLSNLEDENHKNYDKIVTDMKHFDEFEDQFVKGTSKFKVTDDLLENRGLRNGSPDVLNRSYLKYSFDKEATPLTFEKKVDTSVSVRSKYLSVKERTNDDFEASHRVNATKARLQDLEEEMSSLAKKQNERERRNHNLKKILSSSSNNECFEN